MGGGDGLNVSIVDNLIVVVDVELQPQHVVERMDHAEDAMLVLDKWNTADRRHVQTKWEAIWVCACSKRGAEYQGSIAVGAQRCPDLR